MESQRPFPTNYARFYIPVKVRSEQLSDSRSQTGGSLSPTIHIALLWGYVGLFVHRYGVSSPVQPN